MAFSQQNSRELQNRKILEELQLKKQLLLKQGVAQTLGTSISVATTATSTSLPQILVSNDGITINSLQRAALLNAHAASAGYFVTQDSSFGNLILPVLPRFEELEEKLQILTTFEKPNFLLEQYATSPHIASRMLYVAHTQFGDIENRMVADLGAGCGILSVGAISLGASQVIGFDVDMNALKKFNENCKISEIIMETICCDINYILPGKFEKFFETVVMNPPFGTKCNRGIDIKFLEIASKIAKNTIYSLHKSSTRDYVLKKGFQFGFNCQVLAELVYDLPQTYKFHKKKFVNIKVDFIRFSAMK